MRNSHPMRDRRHGRAAVIPAALGRAQINGIGALLLCGGLAVTALARPVDSGAQHQEWRALGVQPLAAGGRTGLRMAPSPAVEPIDVAPERPRIELPMILASGDSLQKLLLRAGAAPGDVASAATMIRDSGAKIAPGTEVTVTLGARAGSVRPLERLAMRAGLGQTIELLRGESGEMRLIRHAIAVDTTPMRVRGQVGQGLYWSLRAAGATPQMAAEYLQALATEIDVGSEVSPHDSFDLVIARRRAASGEQQLGQLLYAGIDRAGAADLQLVKWPLGGRPGWINAADMERPGSAATAWPVSGRITSGFGYRIHPILRFARLHRGIDFGAGLGTPIVAAADGQVTRAGWAGGYGRQVRIAHSGGLATSYSHMSSIVAEEGSVVRAGQLIGYVGSSGLSTGPHLHYEVYRGGVAVNPLSVRFAGGASVDPARQAAVKARLKALLNVGVRG